MAGCEALSEGLWSPERATASIQSSLDYLVYEGKATKDARFWVAPQGNDTRAISASGQVAAVEPGLASLRLPALCTQSAPLATKSKTSNDSAWQVSVHSNNEDLVGWVPNSMRILAYIQCIYKLSNMCLQLPGSNELPFLRHSLCRAAREIHVLGVVHGVE